LSDKSDLPGPVIEGNLLSEQTRLLQSVITYGSSGI